MLRPSCCLKIAEPYGYAVGFFLLFLAIAFYNGSIQKIPNFSYRILPTGQWQITDKQHETLTPGTVITTLRIRRTDYPLDTQWLFPMFYDFKDFEAKQSSFAKEHLLYQGSQTIQSAAVDANGSSAQGFRTLADIQLIDSDGQAHQMALRDYRLDDVQFMTVIMYVLGWLKFLIAFAVLRIGSITPQKRYFLYSSAVMGALCFLSSVAISRQWAIDAEAFHMRLLILQLLYRLYFISLIVIWLETPLSLTRRFGVAKVLLVASLAYTLLTWWLYFFSAPAPDQKALVIYPFLVTYLLSLLVFYFQWWFVHHRNEPALSIRITMRWMLIFIVGCGLVNFGLHIISQLAWIQGNFSYITVLMISIIFSTGIAGLLLHDQLYKIENWWWQIWGLLGALSLGMISLSILAESGEEVSALDFVISGLLGIFCYFLIVNYLRMKYAKARSQLLELLLPDLMTMNAANMTPRLLNDKWRDILQTVFQPRHITLQPADKVSAISDRGNHIAQAGETMCVQAADNHVFVLSHAAQGLKLFSPYSLKKAEMLWRIILQSYQASLAYQAGEAAERKRIAYDLHDDLGGKLLHLSSQGGEFGAYANRTLQDLRTLTHALSGEERTLALIIADMRYQIRELCDNAEIELHFDSRVDGALGEQKLSVRGAINMTCILNELIRNAVQNASTTMLWITFSTDSGQCLLTVENDGEPSNPANWVQGLGTVSIERRVNQLGGTVTWQSREGGGVICRAQWLIAEM